MSVLEDDNVAVMLPEREVEGEDSEDAASNDGSSGREERPEPEGIPFAITPAIALKGILDYRTNSGRKHYERATQTLEEEKFDCGPSGLFQFLESVDQRASDFGWNDRENDGILWIPLERGFENYDGKRPIW